METKKVLLIGYGSTGKRHSRNLMGVGIKPYRLLYERARISAIEGQKFSIISINNRLFMHDIV